ncbi:polysaccharide deacetylase family protein [Streptosporangium sandarakinum]|uniref:polysaccharide deacetylase family protein n=1 Tax=Streptosporangium sandarakinum TaxID=1260955 RepID=UPI0037A8C40D
MRSLTPFAQVIMLVNVLVVAVAVVALLVLPPATTPVADWTRGRATDSPSAAPGPSGSPGSAESADPALPSAELPPPVPATPEFARQVGANEAGMVPVLMYHRIVAKRAASIDRTPAQLRKELERLAEDDYVPVTAREFVTGRMDIPAGKHPVVLTFDDGHSSHFALDDSGAPVKDTAVGVIYDVARRYPGFRPVATFWVNREPFGLRAEKDQKRAVDWLASHGFEVANHTWRHPYLPAMPKKKVAEQLARTERLLGRLGVGPSETLALPYGAMPRKRSIVQAGKWDGVTYRFKGVFLAGAQPSESPFTKGYDWRAIQRIQSNGKKGECRRWCSQYWLEWLRDHPDRRYTADGDPAHISVPKGLRGKISSRNRGRVIVY